MTPVLGENISRGVLRRAGQGILFTTRAVAAGRAGAAPAAVAGSSRRFPSWGVMVAAGLGPHGSRSMSGTVPNDESPRKISIGDVTVEVDPPQRPELVPLGYGVAEEESQDTLAHLRWMLQKHALGQDIFLIGGPGPRSRRLAMHFCEVAGLEVEYLRLTRDTTEADLKLRRDISGGTARWTESAPVRAALNGRVLILDGIEKAERNVLPTLNNLLENREMALEDGRFMMSARRYDELAASPSASHDFSNIVPVSKAFRIIALGLQVPKFAGFPLDPPLRSRFQARLVNGLSDGCSDAHLAPIPKESMQSLIKVASTLALIDTSTLHMTDHLVQATSTLISHFPEAALAAALRRAYPYHIMPPPLHSKGAGQRHDFAVVADAMRRSGIDDNAAGGQGTGVQPPSTHLGYRLCRVSREGRGGHKEGGEGGVQLTFKSEGGVEASVVSTLGADPRPVQCPDEGNVVISEASGRAFVYNPSATRLISDVCQDLAVGATPCIVGGKGCGKSAVVSQVAHLLGYSRSTTSIHVYKDMGARDLLVRRTTSETGDSMWELSPLLKTAVSGGLAVLDGVHRLSRETLSSLAPLLHDGMVSLPQGGQLVSSARFDQLVATSGLSAGEMEDRGILRIDPSFRLVAISAPPTAKANWLTAETASLFSFHQFPSPTEGDVSAILHSACSNSVSPAIIDSVLAVAKAVDTLTDDVALHGALALSLRQIIRMARRLAAYPDDGFLPLIQRTCMTSFLPSQVRKAFDDKVKSVVPSSMSSSSSSVDSPPRRLNITIDGGMLDIGGTSLPVREPKNLAKVPKVEFYDIDQHVRVLQEICRDFVGGERHILLIGNQGVGKNKIADRLCDLLQYEREYIQLHRDTTVQALTIAPTLIDGVLSYSDSPLVKACKKGRLIIIDEADKAPLEVVCILKGLLEDGHMILGDGRRLVSAPPGTDLPPDTIAIHPDFQAIVLANRPGWPFLGNDFFHECGDVFSCHLIDNPDRDSELQLLREYGSGVEEHLLVKLTDIFTDLRQAVASGRLSYPYSTRELVNLVRHAQAFPSEALHTVTENVIAFDKHNASALAIVRDIFSRHGVPIITDASPSARGLSKPEALPEASLLFTWTPLGPGSASSISTHALKTKEYQIENAGDCKTQGVTNERLAAFNERIATWQIPDKLGSPASVVALPDGSIHVLVSPLAIHSYKPPDYSAYTRFDLSDYLSVLNEFSAGLHLVPLPSLGKIALLSASAGICLIVDPVKSTLELCHSPELRKKDGNGSVGWDALFGGAGRVGGKRHQGPKAVCKPLCNGSSMLVYSQGGETFFTMDMARSTVGVVKLPKGVALQQVHQLTGTTWMLQSTEGRVYHGTVTAEDGEGSPISIDWLLLSSTSGDSFDMRSSWTHAQGAHLMATPETFMSFTDKHWGDVDLASSSAGFVPIASVNDVNVYGHMRDPEYHQVMSPMPFPGGAGIAGLVFSEGGDGEVMLDLEVVDAESASITRVPCGEFVEGGVLRMCVWGEGQVATVVGGVEGAEVSAWHFDRVRLKREEGQWRRERGLSAVGEDGEKKLRMTRNWEDGKKPPEAKGPKHGKAPDGKRHAGGNTWQGGTGGSDTAGMGGKGGPYRLDLEDGHDVMQLSDEEKANISKEALEAAREMGQEELRKKLEEINMSPYEAQLYDRFYEPVAAEVEQLRVVLQSVEARAHEREWLKLQSFGDLDDNRLVDGATGDRNIFRRRSDIPPDPGAPQQKPKRLRFVLDVSGSMYRFNSMDRRLERCCQMAIMIMEALDGFEGKYSWSIAGHSGDGPVIDFVDYGKPPKDRTERLKVVKQMWAHSQYCMSGDTTLEAADAGVDSVLEEEGDDHFVMLLSDANLKRYAIPPEELGQVLTRDPKVKAYALFIAGGKEAERLAAALPFGRGLVCMDTRNLPSLFKEIFAAASLEDTP